MPSQAELHSIAGAALIDESQNFIAGEWQRLAEYVQLNLRLTSDVARAGGNLAELRNAVFDDRRLVLYRSRFEAVGRLLISHGVDTRGLPELASLAVTVDQAEGEKMTTQAATLTVATACQDCGASNSQLISVDDGSCRVCSQSHGRPGVSRFDQVQGAGTIPCSAPPARAPPRPSESAHGGAMQHAVRENGTILPTLAERTKLNPRQASRQSGQVYRVSEPQRALNLGQSGTKSAVQDAIITYDGVHDEQPSPAGQPSAKPKPRGHNQYTPEHLKVKNGAPSTKKGAPSSSQKAQGPNQHISEHLEVKNGAPASVSVEEMAIASSRDRPTNPSKPNVEPDMVKPRRHNQYTPEHLKVKNGAPSSVAAMETATTAQNRARNSADAVNPSLKVDMIKYAKPGEDLDWTKITDPIKRVHVQATLRNRRYKDKRQAAEARETSAAQDASEPQHSSLVGAAATTKRKLPQERLPERTSKRLRASQALPEVNVPALHTEQVQATTSHAQKPEEQVVDRIPQILATASPNEGVPSGASDLADAAATLRAQAQPIQKQLPSPPPSRESITAKVTGFAEVFRVISDDDFVNQMKEILKERRRGKTMTFAVKQARRILRLLEVASPPEAGEALLVSGEEAAKYLVPCEYFPGPIVTHGQQPLALHTVQQFLSELYDDTAQVHVQDPGARVVRGGPHVRAVTVGQVKERFANAAITDKPWNLLELATHREDGLRPAFLNSEDCCLLSKVKIPGKQDSASRRGYQPGWKEVEKWALVAQAGALTEPHQDSHGYSTYITVNQGVVGFGWLSHPTADERSEWRLAPFTFDGGRWRYVVLHPGMTVFFPAGTIHFVFRLPSLGNTLAFGGHILRCSQIARWAAVLLEEKGAPNITNEDLSVSAPAYLERVEGLVKQAMQNGTEARWGGRQCIEEFLRLKGEFVDGTAKGT